MSTKWLKLGLISVMLMSSVTQFAVAKSGDSRGGGDTSPDTPTSAQEIIQYITHVKQPLRYVLNEGEMAWGQGLSKYPLFFHPSKNMTAQRLMENLKFVPKVDGPCIDKKDKNHPHDGSASNDDPNEICISVDTILDKKISTKTALSKVVALAAHELTHRLLGYDKPIEDVANWVQSLATAPFVDDDYKNYDSRMIFDTEVIMENVDSSTVSLGQTKEIGCASMVAFEDSVRGLSDEFCKPYQKDLAVLPIPTYQKYLFSDMIRSSNLANLCLQENSDPKKITQQGFAGRQEISLQEFNVRVYNHDSKTTMVLPEDPIQYVGYQDVDAARVELGRIKTALQSFRQVLLRDQALSKKDEAEGDLAFKKYLADRQQVEADRTKLKQKAETEELIKAEYAKIAKEHQAALDHYNAASVSNNPVSDFDAKGFALGIQDAFQVETVTVLNVSPAKGLTELLKITDRIGIQDRVKVHGNNVPLSKHSSMTVWIPSKIQVIPGEYTWRKAVNVEFMVEKGDKSYNAKTTAVYAQRASDGKQVAWIDDIGSSLVNGQTKWRDEWGESYDPHLDGGQGHRSLFIGSQQMRETDEASLRN